MLGYIHKPKNLKELQSIVIDLLEPKIRSELDAEDMTKQSTGAVLRTNGQTAILGTSISLIKIIAHLFDSVLEDANSDRKKELIYGMIIAALKDTDLDFEFFVKTMEKEGALKVNKIPKIT